MGLGMQLIGWHEDFVALLVARGFRVIRFDNRDVGLCQGFDQLGVPSLVLDSLRYALRPARAQPLRARRHGRRRVGVLDALGIAQGARRRRFDGRHDRAAASRCGMPSA